jgi:myosin heavy subunit
LQVIQSRTVELAKLRVHEEQLLTENKEIRHQLGIVSQQFEQCNLELHTLRERCNEMSHLYAMKEAQLNEECKQRMFLQQVENELRARLNDLHIRNQEISSQLDVFNEMNLNYENTLSIKDKEKRSLLENIQQLKDQVSGLQENLSTIEGRRDVIENEIRKELDKVTDQLKTIENERDGLKTSYRDSKSTSEENQKSLESLQAEHGSLSDKYSKIQENKQLMQQALIDQLNSERETVRERDNQIESLKEKIEQSLSENTRLQGLLEEKQKHRDAAKTKKKILKKLAKKKEKVEVLDESLSNDKENDFSIVSITSYQSDCTQKHTCNSSILSDSANQSLNCSSMSNATLKSYGHFENRQPAMNVHNQMMVSNLPLSTQQQQVMMNTSVHSTNSSIIYPSPMAYAQQTMYTTALPQHVPAMVNHPHQVPPQRYIGMDGKPMDLFELAYQGGPGPNSSLLLDSSMTQYGHHQSFEYDVQPQRERFYHPPHY